MYHKMVKGREGLELLEPLEEEREQILQEVAGVLDLHRHKKENLIPILQEVQDRVGYLPLAALGKISEALEVPPVDVFDLATFYNQFRLNPPGKYQLKVCLGTACHMIGGKIVLDSFARRLDLGEGETSPDRKFSLERVACVGCCAIAPVVMVGDIVEGKVTPTRVDGILLGLEDKEKNERDRDNGPG